MKTKLRLQIQGTAETCSIPSLLRFTPGITADDLRSAERAGAIPEGKDAVERRGRTGRVVSHVQGYIRLVATQLHMMGIAPRIAGAIAEASVLRGRSDKAKWLAVAHDAKGTWDVVTTNTTADDVLLHFPKGAAVSLVNIEEFNDALHFATLKDISEGRVAFAANVSQDEIKKHIERMSREKRASEKDAAE